MYSAILYAEYHKNSQTGYVVEHDYYLMQSTCNVGNNDGNTTFDGYIYIYIYILLVEESSLQKFRVKTNISQFDTVGTKLISQFHRQSTCRKKRAFPFFVVIHLSKRNKRTPNTAAR